MKADYLKNISIKLSCVYTQRDATKLLVFPAFIFLKTLQCPAGNVTSLQALTRRVSKPVTRDTLLLPTVCRPATSVFWGGGGGGPTLGRRPTA